VTGDPMSAGRGLARGQVVLLAGRDVSTRMVCHALRRRFGKVPAILEECIPSLELVRRRVKRLGLVTVAGQIGFRAVIVPVLRARGARRLRNIVVEHGLDASPITEDVFEVPSANAPETHALLRDVAPGVVVVNGTRILTRETLGCVRAPFLNTHAGITPSFRGTHGGYWALAAGRPDLVGTTVHLVDAGIDTGEVVAQATFHPGPDDSFATYPYLHTAAGLSLLVEAVGAALEGRLTTRRSIADGAPSVLHTHPTAWGYLWRRMAHDVR
jgi:folate-dependent phosphoribosylglycinamide formyltransferase PurN